ncbi:MAG: DPP IV N-terminal domain-containing protein [Flavobacteriales bacterium]|jgi:dipeptidyl-peptidase-4|nr:DPP IV N-terminal domain-containing protein [Flavobacteriales bacterium]
MRKIILLASSLCLFSFTGLAQQELTLENAVLKQYRDYYPERIYQFRWLPEGGYSMVESNELIITLPNNEIKKVRLSDFKGEKLKYFPPVKWLSQSEFLIHYKDKAYRYNIKENSFTEKTYKSKGAEELYVSPNHEYTAYVKEKDLYLKGPKKDKRVANSKEDFITYGKVVHRHEFGVETGAFWSPKSNYLAYYRNNECCVADYPLVHTNTRIASLENIKYPMAGESSEQVTVEILNVAKRKSTKVRTGKPKDQYLTNITFGPDEKYLYIGVLNRDQNHLKMNQYDVKNGKFIKTLFEEKSDKYVQPVHAMKFIPGHKNEFLWRSRRDGYNYIYRYNTDGELLNKVTSSHGDVKDVLGFYKGDVVYTAYTNNGMEVQVFRSDFTNEQTQQITTEKGIHRASLSKNGAIYDVYSNLNTPHISRIIDLNGKITKELLKSKNPLENIAIAQTKLSKITAADGSTILNTRMILPKDFDENKKYPALVYVYNGPNVQLITNSWLAGASLWMHYMANKGYIVYTVDGRGSGNRGRHFEQATFRNLGFEEMKDQIKGVEFLKSQKYIDGNRIAVHGWSYGGFMTTGLLLNYPEQFTCGVAGGPVMDWSLYEVMYTERYMDTPKTNKEGFQKNNWNKQVEKLQDPLLLIHGAIDDVVVWQHSLEFVRNCVSKGVQVDYFAYPEHKHNVRGKDRVHLMQKVLNYIEKNNQ